MLSAKEIQTIGQDRYWKTVNKRIFIFMAISIAWAVGLIIAAYSIGIVTDQQSYVIKPYMIETYGYQEELHITIEGRDVYLEDFRLPDPAAKQDISLPFIAIAGLPMAITFTYFCYCGYKAEQAGLKLLEEFYSSNTEVNI